MEVSALRPRKPLLGLAVSAIAGVTVADWLPVPTIALAIAVAIGAIVTFVRPAVAGVWVVTALAFAVLHSARHVNNSARLFGESLDKPSRLTAAGIVWSEPVEFANPKGSEGGTFWLKIEQCEPEDPVIGQLCLVRWSSKPPVYGDRVRIHGMAQRLEPPRNPGQFDVSRWLSRQGVYFEIKTDEARDCEVLGHDAGSPLRSFGIAGRAWIKDRLNAGLPPDAGTSTLINSMVLGLRGDSPDDLKELFQKTGTLHLFAVSGLNVAMLIMILLMALRVLRVRGKVAALVIIPCLAAYAIVVGLSASCARATVVGIVVVAATIWERDAIPLNSLGAAAFAILACDTNELFNPGFQLSFILVLVIMAFSRWLQKKMEKAAEPDDFIPQRLWTTRQQVTVWIGVSIAGMLAVGLTAWFGSVLLMCGYFHLVSPVGIIANLAAVPLAFFILALGILSLVAGLACAPAAVAVNHANWACAKLLIWVVNLSAQIPQGHHYIEWPSFAQKPACEIVALDVGDGAAIHVRTGSSDCLIDAGHQRDYARVLLPYLRSRGVDRLDGLWLTHGDASHVGGAALLLDDFHPRWIAEVPTMDRSSTRRAFHAELAAKKLGRRFYCRGDTIDLGSETKVRVLYPPTDLPPQNLADDKSLVLQLETRGRRVLFTADIGFSVEEWLLKNEPDLKSDVLVKGWANRDFSGTPDFIRAVKPWAIVCSAQEFGADDQRFDDWAKPILKSGIKIFPQAKTGAVRVAIEQSGDITIAPWKQ